MKDGRVEIPAEAEYVTREAISPGVGDSGSLSPYDLSPYDIPMAANVSYDEENLNFQIKFEYLTPREPTSKVDCSDLVSLETGDYTGKLYAVSVGPVDQDQVDDSALENIESALEQARNRYDYSNRPEDVVPYLNLSLVKGFVSERGSSSVSGLIAG